MKIRETEHIGFPAILRVNTLPNVDSYNGNHKDFQQEIEPSGILITVLRIKCLSVNSGRLAGNEWINNFTNGFFQPAPNISIRNTRKPPEKLNGTLVPVHRN